MPKRRSLSTQFSASKRPKWSPVREERDQLAAATPASAVYGGPKGRDDHESESGRDSSGASDNGQRAERVAIMTTPVSDATETRPLRKRSALTGSLDIVRSAEDASDRSDSSEYEGPSPGPSPARKNLRALSHVDMPGWQAGPASPRRLYGWRPAAETLKEHEALSRLVEANEAAKADAEQLEYTYISLNQFSIYKPADNYKHALTLVSLHELTRDRHQEFCFDGVLFLGDERYFVESVRFRVLTVDGYDDTNAMDIENQLCVQSLLGAERDVWYQLRSPSVEYRRFYAPFLWVACFTKLAIQYMLVTQKVVLQHFRKAFHSWIYQTYGNDASIRRWLDQAKTTDFAVHFAAHADFLWKESHGVQQPGDEIKICKHPVWGEALPYSDHLKAIPRQPSSPGVPKTVVTPFAYESFGNMYFADQLLGVTISDPRVLTRVEALKAERGLTPWYAPSVSNLTPLSISVEQAFDTLAAGDVVAMPPEQDSKWQSSAETWYAYIQRVWEDKDNEKRLDVVWLYHPEDTTIGKAQYAFSNELFFSDNCGCGMKEARYLDEVTRKVDIVWNPRNPRAQQGLFIRQKFRTIAEMDHYDFRKLQGTDYHCCHQTKYVPEPDSKYQIGDTVLVEKRKDVLGRNCEPAQLVGFGANNTVQLRRLLHKKEVDPTSRSNELLLTSEVFSRSCERLVRECHVRFFTQEQIQNCLPTPYDRDGAGDYYFIAATKSELDDPTFPPMRQGWNPTQYSAQRKLRGLGIFCGGGTFDRGLQEGGAVRFTHAVDYAEHALHSYKANASEPVKFFLGSVDDYLSNAMSGTSMDNTATAGEIEVISAGSPCQGFSRLQLNTASMQSRKNASMVASVVSFVDFYVPEYLILENVVSMTEAIKERKEQNVFSQIIAALVGLGYQVQQFLMDAWSYSSPQQRSRVFIIATAPSAVPMSQPETTHAHPTKNLRTRNLGKSSNGQPFGSRRTDPFVAFPFVSAEQAVADLPVVYDSVPQLCPRFPDHRLASLEAPNVRARIAMVPTRPRGWGLVQAYNKGMLRGEPAEYFERTRKNHVRSGIASKSYARVDPDYLFPTIVTRFSVGDGMNGKVLHWDQHRPLTVMEARRALGYLDHEVLIGTPDKQLHVVGNSVDRKVALVLGLALRASWLQSGQTKAGNETDQDAGHVSVKQAESSLLNHEDYLPSTANDSLRRDSTGSDYLDEIDNRTVKMSLNLTRDEIQGIKAAGDQRRGAFKEIFRLRGIAPRRQIHSRQERPAARN